MSQLLIQKYLNELHDLRKVSGTSRETVVREAFKTLLKEWGRSHDLVFVTEYEIITPAKERRLVDGALLHGAPGRAHPLWGESPLQARQRELLAGRQGCPPRGGI